MRLNDLIKEVELDTVETTPGNVKFVTRDGRFEIHSTNVHPATGEIGKTWWRIYSVQHREYGREYYRSFDIVKGVVDKYYARQGVEIEDEDVDPRDKNVERDQDINQ